MARLLRMPEVAANTLEATLSVRLSGDGGKASDSARLTLRR